MKLYRGRILNNIITITEEVEAEKKANSYKLDRGEYNKFIKFISLDKIHIEHIYTIYFEATSQEEALDKYKKLVLPFVEERVLKLQKELEEQESNLKLLK